MDKVLVIDDSAVQAEFLKSILQDEFDVTSCQTAADGLEQARTGAYSLILLDIIMPDMDGFMLLRELKELDTTKHVPVIMITSLADVQHEEKGLVTGAVDYITKPFSPIIIKARVKTHIQLYHYQIDFMEQARIDKLTGVANRHRYEECCIVKWREAVRFNQPFSVCIFDIDKFKLYNDTFGHPAGDKVIAAVAQQASSRLKRATDFFARYGGEEFVAIFLGDSARSAFEHMQTIRQSVEDLHIQHNSPVCPWVTISVGGATCTPTRGDSYDTFLKIADTMLYDAKRLGRNRVVWSNNNKEQWMEK